VTVSALFPTLVYRAPLGDAGLVADLERSVRQLAEDDGAGRRWSRDHGYKGYTSYASLNDLPARDPAFADLKRLLDRHVAGFAREAEFDLGGRRLKLDSLWVNLLRPGGHHSAHLHPHSAVSGTLYVALPPGAGGLKLEDPRLPMMMAAPLRQGGTHHLVTPEAGEVVLWESWLRHEVVPGTAKSDRISISFNYR
jgi:uncharacterized protein (TIGR02466 family)